MIFRCLISNTNSKTLRFWISVKDKEIGPRKWEPIIDNPMARRYRIMGLEPRERYRIYMYATSRVGPGEERYVTVRTTHAGRECNKPTDCL